MDRPSGQQCKNDRCGNTNDRIDLRLTDFFRIDGGFNFFPVDFEHITHCLNHAIFPAGLFIVTIIRDHRWKITYGNIFQPQYFRQTFRIAAGAGFAIQDHRDNGIVIVVMRGKKVFDLFIDPM